MSKEYSTPFETDAGQEVLVTFEFTPGTPETGAYNCPPEDYDPGSGPELYILHVRPLVDNKPGIEDIKLTPDEIERFHDENESGDWGADDRAYGEECLAEQRAEDLRMERDR